MKTRKQLERELSRLTEALEDGSDREDTWAMSAQIKLLKWILREK